MSDPKDEYATWPRRKVYGGDFSGAVDAGRRIWIATGAIQRKTLQIEQCQRGEDLHGSGRGRDRCLAALRDFIRKEADAVFGLDFPFGLPAGLVEEKGWEEFVRAFPKRYASPEEFREACRGTADGRELRRITDVASRTPFSPYNLRLYRQTYFGIRDLLAPLVADRSAYVLPMQSALPGVPWILEICPASLLKREGLYAPYKGTTRGHGRARARILDRLEASGELSLPAAKVRRAVVADPNGDALDSVLAALGTFRALRNPDPVTPLRNRAYTLEGYVYA